MDIPRNTYAKGDRYYDKTANNYDKRRKKQEWWHVEQDEMKVLLDQLPKNLKVVDIPFGTGRFVKDYMERGYEVHGLDASGDMIEASRQSIGDLLDQCDTQVGDATNLPYEDREFDLLVSTRFLRDIILFGQSKKAMAEFSRVTKQYAIIQLGHTIEGGRIPEDDETMHSCMSEAQLIQYLAYNSFRILDKRLVKETPEENCRIFHFLLEKV
ncbi:MAG: class I SAM-dependent methyltransferase [Halocynthiibacter sp.]